MQKSGKISLSMFNWIMINKLPRKYYIQSLSGILIVFVMLPLPITSHLNRGAFFFFFKKTLYSARFKIETLYSTGKNILVLF